MNTQPLFFDIDWIRETASKILDSTVEPINIIFFMFSIIFIVLLISIWREL